MTSFKLILASFLLCLLVSCDQKEDLQLKLLKGHSKSSIFNLNTLLTEEENDVSFPIWFNDSIIKANRLFKITRKTFLLNGAKENPFKTISGAVPREMREYYFAKDGGIIQLNVHYYYDDREIGSILFSYSGERDAFGFSQVKRKTIVTKTAKRISETHELFDPEERELDFKMHIKRKGSKKYLAYQDMETGDFVYYMLKPKYWGVLSIDSILKPNPRDIVAWGTPEFPSKRYQVTNKVNEHNVKEFIYDARQPDVLSYWIKKAYPFDYKRTFAYNDKGVCNAYTDSTFAGGEYVTRMISTIQLNKKNQPLFIVHEKENPSNEKEYFSIETFEYDKIKPRK